MQRRNRLPYTLNQPVVIRKRAVTARRKTTQAAQHQQPPSSHFKKLLDHEKIELR